MFNLGSSSLIRSLAIAAIIDEERIIYSQTDKNGLTSEGDG